jgi:hypothetical protein
MTPQQARAALDRHLANAGADCTLVRLLGTQQAPVSVIVRAHVTDYTPQTLIAGSGLQAGDSKVIISTTQIDAAQWPGAVPAAQATPGDPRVPRKGDRLIVSGRTRTVLYAWEAPRINGELVRIEMEIR